MGVLLAEGGKGGVNSYAKRVAFVVAHCSVGILSDSVSSVVAPTNLSCSIFFIGLATVSAERKIEVVHSCLAFRWIRSI
jgi:hypothetical protein